MAEVVHAVRDEMAKKLSDVVYRRTVLVTGTYPGEQAMDDCVRLMAAELGWDNAKMERELDEIRPGFTMRRHDAVTDVL